MKDQATENMVGRDWEFVKEALESFGFDYRVTKQDGESMVTTANVNPNRLNFELNDGIVEDCYYG